MSNLKTINETLQEILAVLGAILVKMEDQDKQGAHIVERAIKGMYELAEEE